MAPFDRTDRLRWQAASLLAAAPVLAVATAGPATDMAPPSVVPTRSSLVEQLHQRVLAGHSATATLEAWCVDLGLAPQPRVRAIRAEGMQRAAPPEVREALRVAADTPLRYRRVQLACGQRILSEADNWYIPSLLTPAMNAALDGSEQPFGRVVGPLGFQRQTLSDQAFQPARGNGADASILEIRAVLLDHAGRPFSYVVENYLQGALPP